MSPLVALHATNFRYREGIYARGLLPSQPAAIQDYGVYVFSDDDSFEHAVYSRASGGLIVHWACDRGQDVWQVAYIGPLCADRFVANGLVLLHRVPPEHVKLVTFVKGH